MSDQALLYSGVISAFSIIFEDSKFGQVFIKFFGGEMILFVEKSLVIGYIK
jgi:hypothetical protein